MILDVTRGHIRVQLLGRTATVQGEMFFPGNSKVGFVAYSDNLRFWDAPHEALAISESDKQLIFEDIKADFGKGGHTLEIE
ncbi:Imm74 family immunity protein [Ralstonia pseudosolanacearum]|uniref:Imm74 family immunity protein n=1 Tax=Ralstonia pseudosolanacearum TaxID=1310165 RepID=UPI0018A386A1|nr:Imm74 family immunity protein [Ralstonia pseudosolanacearum]BCL90889.1 hypothetical protein MAFF211479_05900 [Ralstonia solanacearum]BCN03453.1 hypothetical protein RPSB_05900 [Ralstonia solanacearum]